MDAVPAVIRRLREAPAPWRDVCSLLDLSDLQHQSLNRTPMLFVVNLQETATPDLRGSGPLLQTVRQTLGVILVEQVHNRTPDLTPMRQEIRHRLFGWAPDGFEAMSLAGGRLLNIKQGQVAWIDQFTTEYTEDANDA